MRKIYLLVLILLISSYTFSQCVGNCTTVSGTLVDSNGQVWSNAFVQAQLVPPFGNPAPLLNNGQVISDAYQSTATNGLGSFSLILDDNSKVFPTGSRWNFIVCPNATVTNCSQGLVFVSGTLQSVSTTLSNLLIPPTINAGASINRSYGDTESNGGTGSLYWDTINNVIKGCPLGPCPANAWNIIGNLGIPGASGSIPFNGGSGAFSTSTGLVWNNSTNTLTSTNISGSTSTFVNSNSTSINTTNLNSTNISGTNFIGNNIYSGTNTYNSTGFFNGINTFTRTGVYTNTQNNLNSQFNVGTCSPLDIFQNKVQISTSVFTTDAVTACIGVPVGSTVLQANAISGYATTSAGIGSNVVAGYFVCVSLITNGQCWGINPLVTSFPGAPSNMHSIEADSNIWNTGDTILGVNSIGFWNVHPSTSSAFLASKPLGPGAGVGWDASFVSSVGASPTAFFAQPVSNGAASFSQNITFESINPSNTPLLGTIDMTFNGDIELRPSSGRGVTINTGANIIYRCATAGALPAGALTITAGSCGTTQDSGLRIP